MTERMRNSATLTIDGRKENIAFLCSATDDLVTDSEDLIALVTARPLLASLAFALP